MRRKNEGDGNKRGRRFCRAELEWQEKKEKSPSAVYEGARVASSRMEKGNRKRLKNEGERKRERKRVRARRAKKRKYVRNRRE